MKQIIAVRWAEGAHTIELIMVCIAVIWIICGFVFQQLLARRLLRNGVCWPNREIAGNLRRPFDQLLWLIYLISWRWKSIPDRSLRNQCRFWAVCTVIVGVLWLLLIAALLSRIVLVHHKGM